MVRSVVCYVTVILIKLDKQYIYGIHLDVVVKLMIAINLHSNYAM